MKWHFYFIDELRIWRFPLCPQIFVRTYIFILRPGLSSTSVDVAIIFKTLTLRLFFLLFSCVSFRLRPDVLNIVKDGNYGAENESGGWNGMVGELVRRVSLSQFISYLFVFLFIFLFSSDCTNGD